MTTLIFDRENLKLFKKTYDEPTKVVYYGTRDDNIPIRQFLNFINFIPDDAIYIPFMYLADGSKIVEIEMPAQKIMNNAIINMNNDQEILSIIYHIGLGFETIIIKTETSLRVCVPIRFVSNEFKNKLDVFDIRHKINDYYITFYDLLIPETYYVLGHNIRLLDYKKITGQELHINYALLFERYPKWARWFFETYLEYYPETFSILLEYPELYDISYELLEKYIERFDNGNITKVQMGYYNLAQILLSQPDPTNEIRDLVLKYLFLAGDIEEAKRLRTRLFAERLGLDAFKFDTEVNLDYETLLKFALSWAKEQ